MSAFSFSEFLIEVNKGNVAGHELVHWFGDNSSIGTTEEDIWGSGGTLTHLQIARQMNIISTDTINDISTGDNTRKVYIEGLDADFNPISEFVDLKATNTLTDKFYIRVFRIISWEVGTYGARNLGTITAKDSNGATIQCSIEEGEGQSTTTHYTIPAGFTGFMIRSSITIQTGKEGHVHVNYRPGADVVVVPFTGSREIHHWEGIAAPVDEHFNANHMLVSKSDVWFSATATQAAVIQADYDILLVRNDLVPELLNMASPP